MNLVAKAVDKLVNPPRVSDPDGLRAAVSGKTALVTGGVAQCDRAVRESDRAIRPVAQSP